MKWKVHQMNRKSCEGCLYYKDGNGRRKKSSYERFCHYMIDEGKPRNCDPANCDKKVIDLPIPRLGALPLPRR